MKETTPLYLELYNRNGPIIPLDVQKRLGGLKIAVAGCGSTGGAFLDGALRLGITSYHLADNGTYEVTNLNRQMVTQKEMGVNKATANAGKISAVNPETDLKVWDQGLTPENVDAFLAGRDFLFDAVDVTTASGMAMKLLLHEKAAEKGIPTGSALDLGYTQWLQSYNYQKGEEALHGRLADARKISHPLKSLIAGFSSVEELPLEISDELIRLLKEPNSSACQLACACFLLSAMVTPYLIHFVKKNQLPPLTSMDLLHYFETADDKKIRQIQTQESHQRLQEILSTLA